VISAAFVASFAKYNAWQNQSLYREANRLGDDQRRADMGAFFRSIQRTLCHILTADHIWMSRFDGWDMPDARGSRTPDWVTDWDAQCALRVKTDARLTGWGDRVTDADLSGDLVWSSGPDGPTMTKPRWLLVSHMFNHQTHHRGQVHAMLTRAGMTPDDTDFGFMPEDH
jgi:uncharacterized damage-inducible protein DinB